MPHDRYEELCALAPTGQLTPEETRELATHAAVCPICRESLADFGQLAAQVIPQYGATKYPVDVPDGMMVRFMARARSEGIALSAKKQIEKRSFWMMRPAWFVPIAAIFLVAAGLLFSSDFYAASLGPRMFSFLRLPKAPAAPVVSPPKGVGKSSETEGRLDDLRMRIAALEKQLTSHQQASRSADVSKHQIDTRVVHLENENTQLHTDVYERDSKIAQLIAEANRIHTDLDNRAFAQTVNELQIQADKTELDKLQDRISALTNELSESQHLSEAANQAKDLIVARNLHILDVTDRDGNGKPGPFGRIFYTEGKNLVFYAYDLSDPGKLNAKINFCVWGTKEGTNQAIRNLGMLRTDDAKAGRWVFKFDNADVLAQIDYVFVTAESQKKVATKPSGPQILFASLGKNPNHP